MDNKTAMSQELQRDVGNENCLDSDGRDLKILRWHGTLLIFFHYF